jgi:DNA-binding protein HU-beta
MNKQEFVAYTAKENGLTQREAEQSIDIFVSSVTGLLGAGEEVSLVGFGKFSVSAVEARPGRNPQTGAAIQIKAYNQPKFKTGQKLKDACNKG